MENLEKSLKNILSNITPPDKQAMDIARKRQESLAKPPKSLGELEEISVKLAGITGHVHNKINKKRLLVFAADNGVVEEGVAATPQSVTMMQTINIARGKTGAGTICRHLGVEISVTDVGVKAQINDALVNKQKISMGTKNIYLEPAMTRDDALKAIFVGYNEANKAKQDGVDIIGVGEMGIGNTTTSSAILSVLTDSPVEKVTGKGGGLTDTAFAKKIEVIKHAIDINSPDKNDPIDVISKVGGLDIAAMTGAYIAASEQKIPAVIDGFISIVAALCAVRLCPIVKEYLFASHQSFEIGYDICVKELSLSPFLALNMRLGEGSGCPFAFEVISAACAIINDMATFEEANINDDYLCEIRKGDKFSVPAEKEKKEKN